MAEEAVTVSYQSVPRFDGDYDHWSLVMETLLRSKEFWCVIESEIREPREGETLSTAQKTQLDALKLKDLKARNYLFQSIDKQILRTMTQKESAKQIWDAMKVKYQGNSRVKRAQLQRLRREFEVLEMKEGENVSDYFNRVMVVANDMRNYGEDMTDVKIVEKILRSLTESYNFVVCTIEESKDIDTLSLDELQSSLLVHEQKLKKKTGDDHVMKAENDIRGRGKGRGLPSRGRGRGRGRTRNDFDKSGIECYRCHQMGHFAYECSNGEKAVNFAEFDEGEDLLLMASSEQRKETKTGIWFLDSACSNHMTGIKDWFINLDESYKHNVKLGNDSRLAVEGIGDIRFEVEGITQVVSRVYYVPELTSNLLSIGQLQEKDLTVVIKQGECRIYHPKKGVIIKSVMTRNRMFLVQGVMNYATSQCMKVSDEENTQIWHRRFGHVNYKSVRAMQHRELVKGLPKLIEHSAVCEVCKLGKQQREPIPKRSAWRATEKLQLIHTDLCGPINPISPSGKRYLLVFIDDYSRKGWVYFLAAKSESFATFKRFKAMVENETGFTIKGLRSDRGGEFTSSAFNTYCESYGIKRQLTTAFTPQQNGVAERRNKTIMNMVRCFLVDKALPKWFWSEAANWAAHVLNRCITGALEDKVPEEAWSGIKPSVDYFKVFGCIAYATIPAQLRTKLDDRSLKCLFLGVSSESKAYRLYDPVQERIIISRDVTFDEVSKWQWKREETGAPDLIVPDEYLAIEADEVNPTIPESVTESGTPGSQNPSTEVSAEGVEATSSSGDQLLTSGAGTSSGTQLPTSSTRVTDARTSSRAHKPPTWLQDYQSGEGFSDEEANLALFSSSGDPTTYVEAAKDSKWIQAMEKEIAAIEQNKTWELVEAPANVTPIGVKWLFKTKLNEKGEVDKYKARLVVKGYAQQKGIDYNEVFAPVARWDTIRTMLGVAAFNGWVVWQLDVKSAFLYGELKETIFVEQPQGFVKAGNENKVYRLKKALYGLKQAPRAWFARIEGYFAREGFQKSQYDHTLFIKKVWNKVIMVSLYVDDLIYTGNDKKFCEEFSRSMKKEFDMTDLGQMKYFLGVEVQQNQNYISMCQRKYAKEVLEKFGMWEGNGVKNPIVPGTVLLKECEGANVDDTEYKCLVGSLMYLTVTRPDLMYSVSLIARFMSKPKVEHMQAAKRILRYVKETYDYGLVYERNATGKLEIYTDSDYARDRKDRRCTSGYVCLLSNAAICWSSKKQEVVTLSSTEAEYVAAKNCACHGMWLKGLMGELTGKQMGMVQIKCDNNSTINLSKNPVMHRRTKHIDVRYHYLRELVNKGEVELVFCSTEEQVADVMTKPVKLEVYEKMRSMMGVQQIKELN
ncbi:putative RNA-directed DNA polymerase [Helianthus annuus]|nr:putative RNA-directed DNA polymerase [Helianthus annuus]